MTLFTKAEAVAPFLLADHFGEFAKENIDVKFEKVLAADALPLLATGKVDAWTGGWSAGVFNAASGGADIKWVLGNFTQGQSKQGLWVRRSFFSNPKHPDLSELSKATIANGGPLAGSVLLVPFTQLLSKHGVDVKDLKLTAIPYDSIGLALENKSVDGGWVLDPYWLQLEKNPDMMFVGGQTNDQPLGALNFGSRLLGQDRQVGEAFVRAYIRGQVKYLTGDYHKDPKAMQGLADELGVPLASLTSTPSLRWDSQIKPGTTDEMQKVYRDVDSSTLSYSKNLPESKLVDRSFYGDAVRCLKAEGTLK